MIYEASLFNNENLVAGIKKREYEGQVSKIYLVESNRTFRNEEKEYNFRLEANDLIECHKFDASHNFSGKRIVIRRSKPYVSFRVDPWRNERMQRNFAASLIHPQDDDIVILADVDEIIYQTSIPLIVEEVKKRGIVTIGLHFTMFYLNLFLPSTAAFGPPDFSYHMFVMTGKYFKSMKITSDALRKLGESGKLFSEIYRVPGIHGFHHSWLGDSEFVYNKLHSYSHSIDEHDPALLNKEGQVDKGKIKAFVQSKKSLFGHDLEIRSDVEMLRAVRENLNDYRKYLIS